MPARKTAADYLRELTSDDPSTIIKALDKIPGAGMDVPEVVPSVLPLLQHKNWKIRSAAARCLGRMGPQALNAAPGLAQALSDPMAPVRQNAAVSLGQVGGWAGPEAIAPEVQALKGALSDSSPSVRVAAGIAMNAVGPQEDMAQANQVIDEWHHRVVEKRPPKPATVERYLAALHVDDPKTLTSAMKKLSGVLDANQADLKTLVTTCVPDLVALLEDPSWKVRSWAARLIGRIGPGAEKALPDLLRAFEDPNLTVRQCAVYAAGRLGEKANAAIPLLEKRLHDPDRILRTWAHMALRNLRKKDDGPGPRLHEDDELVSYQIVDHDHDIHYHVVGWIRQRPWPFQTHLLLSSKEYTAEQLSAMVLINPQDYQAKIMFAECMEDPEKKIDYIRENYILAPLAGVDEHIEWQKAWFRLFFECPSYTYIYALSIQDFTVPEDMKGYLELETLDGLSEKLCQVTDRVDAGGCVRQEFCVGPDDYPVKTFERIIRLTYRHFLCRQGSVYTLYHSPDGIFLVPAVQMIFEHVPALEDVLQKIKEDQPELFEKLSLFLWYDPEQRSFTSLYRQYVTGFDDFIHHFAYGRVKIDNQFETIPLDLV